MDILEQMKGFMTRIGAVEGQMITIFKEIRKLQGTSADKKATLQSGSYHARIVPVYYEEHNAFQITIEISDCRVALEKFMEMDEYASMFKRNKRDLELFILIGNVNPLDPEQVKNMKFEIKVSKGVAENQAAIIKDIHAVGFWKEGEFIESTYLEEAK